MTPTEPATPARTSSAGTGNMPKRAIAAAGAGNALEWYDFAVYAFLTPVIAKLFFPTFDKVAGVIATFAVFAVGFGMRPVGAIVFGHTADRFGRKLSLVVLIAVMGAATVLIGAMPTYPTVGLAAPLLLLAARLLQGLALGGEFGTSTSFLVEYAPSRRRGLVGSLVYSTVYCGNLAGGIVVLLVTTGLAAHSVLAWGWRIPFLLSFPLLLVGLYMRLRVADSPQFRSIRSGAETVAVPLLVAVREHWRAMLIVLGINIGFGISAYTVLSFMQSYLSSVLHYPTTSALISVLIGILAGAILTPLAGFVCDRVGRKPMLLGCCVGIAVLAYPSYLLLGAGTFVSALGGQLLLWLPIAGFSGTVPAAFAEMFPTNVRVSGSGVAYALSTAIFSGTTPFVTTLLVRATGSVLSPAWYLIAAGVVTVGFALAVRETVHEPSLITG